MATRRIQVPIEECEDPEDLSVGIDLAAAVRKQLGLKEGGKARISVKLEDPYLTKIFGDGKDYTFRSGQIIEVRGNSSSGKSSIMADIAGKCIRAGMFVHWVDLERFWNDQWMAVRGIRRDSISLYEAYGEEGEVIAVEQVIAQLTAGLKLGYKTDPKRFQLVIVDSLASVVTQEELENLEDPNMKTKLAPTIWTGRFLKLANWAFPSWNAALIVINQTRINPMAMFKSPIYSAVGGEAISFFPSVRVDFHREAKRFVDKKTGMELGIKGYVHAFKQRQGGGEGLKTGYRLSFDSTPVEWFEYTPRKKED
jgi:RecA/RadA recombinase